MAYSADTLPSGLDALTTLADGDILVASDITDSNRVKGITYDNLAIEIAADTLTLTNKTFDVDGTGNTLSNVANANIKASAAIAVDKLEALTASEIVITDASGFIASGAVATYPSLTEIAYVKGVTSAIQTQIDAKANTLSGTINEITYFDSSSTISSLAVATYPSLTELAYVKGVTSAIQTQIDAKGVGDLLADGTVPLTANWDVGAFTITGTQFISDIATGTAPFVVSSTTEVANLKAATVTTNANLTGIVTSTGNATAIADKAISIAKLADGTDGELITWSATGVIETVAVGTSGQVLTSNGAGAAPTFQAAGAGSSPLTTKGDVYTYDTADARLGVGANGTVLTADSTQATGLKWATVAGSGDVNKVGTPVDNQVGVWTGDGTIEGTSGLTYDGANFQLTGDIGSTGTRITKGWFTDLQVTNAIAGSITGNAATVTTITGLAPDTATTQATQPSITSIANLATVGTITAGTWSATDIAVDAGGSGRSSATAYAVICGGTTTTAAHQSIASVGTSGQVLTSNGAGALPTFQAAAGGGLTWSEVTGTSQTATVDNGYITNNASLVTVTLPDTAALGSIVRVAGSGAGGWNIAQNAGETIHFLGTDTTAGVGGSLASTNRYDAIELICITANTDWSVISSTGNITIV